MTPSLGARKERLDPVQRLNLSVITVAQGIYYIASALLTTVGGLAGEALTPNRSLSTAAISVSAAAAAIVAIPSATLVARLGRRRGLALGNLIGIAGAALSALGALSGHFSLLVLGGACFGGLAAFSANYRFAAAGVVPPFYQSYAISLNVGSGVVAALIGPALLRLVPRGAPATAFALPYLLVGAMCAACGLVLLALRLPAQAAQAAPPRAWFRAVPLAALRVPHYRTALISTTAAWVVMNLVMVASPLAMKHDLLLFGAIAVALQSHYIAMYAPSFFTGTLIARYGPYRLIAAGATTIFAAGLVGLLGHGAWSYAVTLALVGLGWNFASVASTALAFKPVPGVDQAGMQGLYNFTVLVAVSLSALAAGALLNRFGWRSIPIATLLTVLVWAAAVASSWARRERAAPPRID